MKIKYTNLSTIDMIIYIIYIYLFIYKFMYLSTVVFYLSIKPFIYLSICQSIILQYILWNQMWFSECNKDYQRLKIRVVCVGNLETLSAYKFNFCIQEIFKQVFEYKITFWICVLVLWIQGYCHKAGVKCS